MPAPRLLPYLPPNPQHNKEELRADTSAYLRELSDRNEESNNSPIATGLKQNDPFRLESWVGGEDPSEKVDPEKIKKLEEQKQSSSQW